MFAASVPIRAAKSPRQRSDGWSQSSIQLPVPDCQRGQRPLHHLDGRQRRQAVGRRVEVDRARAPARTASGRSGRCRGRLPVAFGPSRPPRAGPRATDGGARSSAPAGRPCPRRPSGPGGALARRRTADPGVDGSSAIVGLHAHSNFEPPKLMQCVLRCVNVFSASTPRSSPRPLILWPSYGTLTGR